MLEDAGLGPVRVSVFVEQSENRASRKMEKENEDTGELGKIQKVRLWEKEGCG